MNAKPDTGKIFGQHQTEPAEPLERVGSQLIVKLVSERDGWRKRAEAAEKACAELQEVLADVERELRFNPPNNTRQCEWDLAIAKAQAVLASDAGKDYVHKDVVKPLVEALKHLDFESAALLERDDSEIECEVIRSICGQALAHAREKGLL